MISNIIRIAANAPQRLQPKDSRECGTVVIFRGALFDANMVSSQVEQIVLVASPPQIRVVGFCAKTSAEALTDTISASPHAVAESPLSRMLRSATWPCLRLRLGKNGISPSCNALVCQTHCSTSPTLTNRVHSMPQSSVSSSPISIPGACSWMQEADFEGSIVPASACEVSDLVRGVVHISDSPKVCKGLARQKVSEGGDFSEACWLLE